MRFWTIWTLDGMPLREKLRRTRDWGAREVAARLPLRIRYHVALQEMGRATMTSPNVPATPLSEVLEHMNKPKVLS